MEPTDKTIENNTPSGCGCCSCSGEEHKVAATEKAQVEKTGSTAERKDVRRPVYVPAVDVLENEGEVTLYADVPGVADGGVELTIEKNVLTLVATPANPGIEGNRLAYAEYGVGEYRCSFGLSDEIDRESISASLKDGVLQVLLPKSALVVKKISVAVK